MATIQETVRLLRIQSEVRGAEQTKAQLHGIAAAQNEVAVASQTTERATLALDKVYNRLRTSYDESYRAQQRMATVERQINALRASGRYGLEDLNRLQMLANAQLTRTAPIVNQARGAFGAMGHQVQNAAFQFGDFAVQVASGQGVMRPLIQQGSQFLGIFGPMGAILGAVGAAAGALAVGMFNLGDDTADASTKLETWVEKLERARDAMDDINKRGAQTAASIAAQNRNIIGILQTQIAALATAEQVDAQARLAKLREADLLAGTTTVTPELEQALGQRLNPEAGRQRANILAEIASLGAFDDGRKYFGQSIGTPYDYAGDVRKQQTEAERAAEKAIRDRERAIKDAARAELEFGKALETVLGRIDPVSEAQRKLAHDEGILFGAMARGIEITGGYAKAFEDLEKSYQDALDPMGAALRKLTGDQDKQRRAIEAEAAAMSMSDEQRAVFLARLEAEERLRAATIDLTTDGAQGYIDEAGAIAQSSAEMRKRQQELEANQKILEGFFEQSFDRIGAGITEALATGQIEMVKFGDIGRAIISELIQLAIQLSIINPIKNWATGGNDPTMGGIFQLLQVGLGSLFGPSLPAGSVTTGAGGAGVVQPGGGIKAFANGGDFTVGGSGGTDSQLVRFMATPGERVSVRRPDQAMGGAQVSITNNINVTGGGNDRELPNKIADKVSRATERAVLGIVQRGLERGVFSGRGPEPVRG